jgi:hypothetical protein
MEVPQQRILLDNVIFWLVAYQETGIGDIQTFEAIVADTVEDGEL